MSEITLFKIKPNVKKINGNTVLIEKEIQTIIENNMYQFFGVTFLASEYAFDGGRMDSIGIDENYSPVIFEYKRTQNENVINQGLYYLNWLLEHKDSFELLVLKKLGKQFSDQIDWSIPRVLCIAGDFNKYDEEAIKQINRKVTLFKYRKYDDDLIMFEQLNTNNVQPLNNVSTDSSNKKAETTFLENLDKISPKLKLIYDDIKDFTLKIGDEVSFEPLKLYGAFKKITNFCSVVIKQNKLKMYFKLDPTKYSNECLRDVSDLGHRGTGDLEMTITDECQMELVKQLIQDAYNEN